MDWKKRLIEASDDQADEVLTSDQILSGFEKMIERQDKLGKRGMRSQ